MRAIPSATLSLIALVVFGLAWPRPADARYTLTTLASFNGANPTAGLVRDVQGNLFGTMDFGGAFNNGTAWRRPLAVVRSPASPPLIPTGRRAGGQLVLDAQDNLFGTSFNGAVWKLAAGSNVLTTHALFNGTNGAEST